MSAALGNLLQGFPACLGIFGKLPPHKTARIWKIRAKLIHRPTYVRRLSHLVKIQRAQVVSFKRADTDSDSKTEILLLLQVQEI